jgi:hypothetical protein
MIGMPFQWRRDLNESPGYHKAELSVAFRSNKEQPRSKTMKS